MRQAQQANSLQKDKKVMISTLYPLGGNYGGLMQAYALQRIISELGYETVTINSNRPFSKTRSYLRLFRSYLRKILQRNPGPIPLSNRLEKIQQTLPLQFISEHIATIDFFGLSKKDKKNQLQNLHAIVVGSDQVWRNGYADVEKQLLDYAEEYSFLKISYAASFGHDKLIGYSPSLVEKSARLAKKFSAISVREFSGIKVCKDAWNVDATQNVDPTLLLSKEIYESFLIPNSNSNNKSADGLFFYVLDDNPWIKDFAEETARKLNLKVFSILPVVPNNKNQIKNNISDFKMKSVQEWLNSFAKSDFVITDSFHGTVFSIIFNKPFLVVGNKKRGLSRFESILSTFKLESRLLQIGDNLDIDKLEPINWKSVNETIAHERSRAMTYLVSHLSSDVRSTSKCK